MLIYNLSLIIPVFEDFIDLSLLAIVFVVFFMFPSFLLCLLCSSSFSLPWKIICGDFQPWPEAVVFERAFEFASDKA